MRRLLWALGLAWGLSGCGTLSTTPLLAPSEPTPYSGAREDLHGLKLGCQQVKGPGDLLILMFLAVVDLPLSTAADTVILPVTIPGYYVGDWRGNPRG